MDLVRLALIVSAVVTASGSCGPRRGEAIAVFTDSQSENRWDGNKRIVIRYAQTEDVPKFLFVKGKIYLLVQETHLGLIDTIVYMPQWDAKELTSLSEVHPEFRAKLAEVRWKDLPN